jgi:phage-related protein
MSDKMCNMPKEWTPELEWRVTRLQAIVTHGGYEELSRTIIYELTAERQRREQAERELSDLAWRYGDQHDRLLSALAAIEKHNKRAQWPNCYKIKVDLSALREHDAERTANVWKACEQYVAEVRKPLVDGLNRLMALADVNCLPQARRAYDLALAKEKP